LYFKFRTRRFLGEVPQLRELENSRLNLSVLSKAIEAARVEQGISLRQLAAHLGITPSTLTRVRQGKRPDAEALAVLATWAGVPIAELLAPDDPARSRAVTRARETHAARV
jgi:transcriptional regulator with XRE-family HTH domain